jgi:DNA adenine methylase
MNIPEPQKPILRPRSSISAKPFMKWAGGKGQLLDTFKHYYPDELKQGKIEKYFEPFIGGGAVFFDIICNYKIKKAFLCDINGELIIAYKVIHRDANKLISRLSEYSKEYFNIQTSEREDYFYKIRDEYNEKRHSIDFTVDYSTKWIRRTAQMIFLNRTCFNGLFRVNKKGEFNVPFGKYERPKILDKENILQICFALNIAEIKIGDFTSFKENIDSHSFVYFDPPYRPISLTSSFTSYSKHEFGDYEQIRLGNYYRQLDKETGAKLMLSNSDPANENEADKFFEHLYEGYNINRVSAKRIINSNAAKRGAIKELIIRNY